MELKGEDNGVLGQVALQSLFGKSFQVVDGLLVCTELQVSNTKPNGMVLEPSSSQPPLDITVAGSLWGFFQGSSRIAT